MANNGAIQRPMFQPAMRVVVAITNASQCQVTTSFDHNYFTGDIVRIVVPLGFGMSQISGQFSSIVVTSGTTFIMDINTIGYDPFVYIDTSQFAQSIPIGEVNSTVYGATENTLPTLIRQI